LIDADWSRILSLNNNPCFGNDFINLLKFLTVYSD
jgi:hypothetical protein